MSYAGVESPAPEHAHQHCGDSEPHDTHQTGTYWKPVICTGQIAAGENSPSPLTDDEAREIDFAMSEHMYGHRISNNIGSMACDVGCRTRALRSAVDSVLLARSAQSTSGGLR